MKFNRKHISKLLFIAVFFVYVISPLMFPCGSNVYSGIMPHDGKKNSPESIHISFEKLVLFKLDHQGGRTDKSPNGIIIHKSRTILPEDKIEKLTLLHNLSISADGLSIVWNTKPSYSALTDRIYLSQGFNLLSSDLSPPGFLAHSSA